MCSSDLSGTFTHFPTFHVRDGETFIRIIPLLLPHHNVHYLRATGVEHVEHYQLIALYNVTAFQPTPPPGDGCWHNGFFLEFGHAATDGSFAEFRQRRAAIAVSDSLGHARERRIRVTGPDFDLALAADSYTATVRYATANGVERNAARLTTSDNALNAALDCS